ncbi:MAG: energy transducer TonB [Ignavibacteriaceae bacterium]|nr:energy transducer TonB [Ignavibacteriaceae bacterium]
MKNLILMCICFTFLAGCSFWQETVENNIGPQLLVQYPLPNITFSIARPSLKLEMDMLILEDGSVGKVKMITGSGNSLWDSLAAETILKWKYSPAHVDHHNIRIWMRQIAIVEYQDPQFIQLAEILCPTIEEADSIYAALENGKNFDELAALQKTLPDFDKNGDLGNVDIRLYPERIRHTLAFLTKDSYTKPLKYGDNYVIFKRK